MSGDNQEPPLSITGEFTYKDLWALLHIGTDCPVPEFENVKEDFLNPYFIKSIQAGDTGSVRLLIHLGVEINDNDPESFTPLHLAASCGYRDIVKVLIENGARVDAVYVGPDKLGQTPLTQAALKNHVGCARILLTHGAKHSMNSDEICDPITIAVFKGHLDMVMLLLTCGADVNTHFTNKFFESYKTSLHPDKWKDQNLSLMQYATLKKSWNMVKCLWMWS